MRTLRLNSRLRFEKDAVFDYQNQWMVLKLETEPVAAYPIFLNHPGPTRRFYAWVCCSCFQYFGIRSVSGLICSLHPCNCLYVYNKNCAYHTHTLSLSLSLSCCLNSIHLVLSCFIYKYILSLSLCLSQLNSSSFI